MAVKAKVRDYTEAEWDALDEKMEHPDRKVICPRCGNEIAYEEPGNSISVYCLSENCIFGGMRGL
jgi:UDP-N-acetylmuramyl tripeptide synthase